MCINSYLSKLHPPFKLSQTSESMSMSVCMCGHTHNTMLHSQQRNHVSKEIQLGNTGAHAHTNRTLDIQAYNNILSEHNFHFYNNAPVAQKLKTEYRNRLYSFQNERAHTLSISRSASKNTPCIIKQAMTCCMHIHTQTYTHHRRRHGSTILLP